MKIAIRVHSSESIILKIVTPENHKLRRMILKSPCHGVSTLWVSI
jgi:hypothetical protein